MADRNRTDGDWRSEESPRPRSERGVDERESERDGVGRIGSNDEFDADRPRDRIDPSTDAVGDRPIEPGSPTLEHAAFVILGILTTVLVVARGFGVV